MEDPAERARRYARELERTAQAALSRLKQNPDYPAIHLRVIEQVEVMADATGLKLPRPEIPSATRLEYALSLMDIWAGGYIGLVSTLADQEDFQALLRSYERKAWEIYRGLAEIEPFGANREFAEIQARSLHWYKESLRRLIPRRVSSTLRHPAWEFTDFFPLSFGRAAPAC
jgi:hypothetical protein